MTIDSISFFSGLAAEMNAHPERFQILGDADMVCALVMTRGASPAFAVRLRFEGLNCEDVTEVSADEALQAEYRLEGPVGAWEDMFADIREHGAATGRHTINSLALIGQQIVLKGEDPMGVDKFSRFNQTLQEYFDGAARLTAGVA
jgi:hypothetical protein